MRLNFVLAAVMACTAVVAGAAPLDDAIRAKIAGFQGQVSVYAKNLNSGAEYGLAAEEPVRTASTVSFPS